jgi:hypothetical protein
MRGGEVQGGAASQRARVHLRRCGRIEQLRQHGVHAGEGGGVQWQLAEAVGHVLIRTGSQQLRHHLHVALARLHVRGCPTRMRLRQAQRVDLRAAKCDEGQRFDGTRMGFAGEIRATLALVVMI